MCEKLGGKYVFDNVCKLVVYEFFVVIVMVIIEKGYEYLRRLSI